MGKIHRRRVTAQTPGRPQHGSRRLRVAIVPEPHGQFRYAAYQEYGSGIRTERRKFMSVAATAERHGGKQELFRALAT